MVAVVAGLVRDVVVVGVGLVRYCVCICVGVGVGVAMVMVVVAVVITSLYPATAALSEEFSVSIAERASVMLLIFLSFALSSAI